MILLGKKMDLIMRVQGVIDKSLPGNLKKLANEVKNLRVARQKMEKAQRTLKAQKELNKEIMNNVSKYRKLRNELKALDEIKKRNNSLTDAEKKKYESLTKKAKALETTIKAQSKSFQKYGMELKKLKIPFDNLQSEIDQTIKKEKELLAQQSAIGKIKGTFQNVKGKIKTGMKVAAIATIGAAIGIGTSSVKEYLEFDKQMIKVKALTGATAEEYEALKKKAMEVGKTTIFTSEEAAIGMQKFALAGHKTKQIIEEIPPIFDLAAASGEDFVMIADMISDHMKNFNIKTSDMGHVADVLANTVSNTNVNVQMISESLKYVSNSAMSAGMDLETTAAAIGLMGDSALKSGRSGRYLVDALSSLKEAKVQRALKKMGVNVLDAQGKFVGFTNVMKQLDKVIDKNNPFKTQGQLIEIFGKQGSEAFMNILMAEKEINGTTYKGVEALEKFIEANRNAIGKAKEMSDTILDSPSGKWALLQSAISDVKLKIGQAIFTKGGKQLIDIAIEWLNELSNVLSGNFNDTKANKFWQSFIENGKIFLDALVQIGKALWGIFTILNKIGIDKILIFLTILSVLSKIVQFVTVIIPIIKVVWMVISAIGAAIAAVGGAVVAVVAAIVAVIAGVIYLVIKYWDEIKAFVKAIPGFLVEFFTGVWNVLSGVIGAIWQGIVDLFNWILNKITWLWDKIVGVFSTLWSVLTKIFSTIWDKITGFFQGLWESITGLWDKVKTGFSERFTAMLNSFKDTIASIAEKIKGFFAKPFELMSDAIAGAKEKALDFARKIPGMKYIIGEKENIETAKATINGSHANGLNYVPFDGYIAELHKGERVLTKDENESIFGSLRNRLQNATQSSKSENSTSSEKSITYQIYNSFTFNGVSEDTKDSIIEKLQEKLNEFERQLEKMKEERETYARTSL
ncbi:phage tail tape measure protein [Fusobacterium polymorphum]|uniref:phage tail tape measure protein n=1 Tax=Fusobacterium nucleatum subsp. polymorphum TaxID=76857 RepID=UPI00300B8B36